MALSEDMITLIPMCDDIESEIKVIIQKTKDWWVKEYGHDAGIYHSECDNDMNLFDMLFMKMKIYIYKFYDECMYYTFIGHDVDLGKIHKYDELKLYDNIIMECDPKYYNLYEKRYDEKLKDPGSFILLKRRYVALCLHFNEQSALKHIMKIM